MTTQEKKIMRYQYWKLLVAQSANIDEFGEKNYNIDQRLLVMMCRKPPRFNAGI